MRFDSMLQNGHEAPGLTGCFVRLSLGCVQYTASGVMPALCTNLQDSLANVMSVKWRLTDSAVRRGGEGRGSDHLFPVLKVWNILPTLKTK